MMNIIYVYPSLIYGGENLAKTSPYDSGELTDSIFLILLSTLQPSHGYKIMQQIQETTKNLVEIGPATMYTTLRKLLLVGWISEQPEGDSKILYTITAKGKEVLIKNYLYRKSILQIASIHMEELL